MCPVRTVTYVSGRSNVLPAIDWPDRKEKGTPDTRSQANVKAYLAARGVALVCNSFSLRNEITLDGHTTEFSGTSLRQIWLEADALGLKRVQKEFFGEVCFDVARQNTYHPVRDFLDGLKWDGVQRVGGPAGSKSWLTTYARAPDTPLNRAIGRVVLVAAVRRIRQPGSKFDNCLVLEGEQYVGKSTLVRTLAGDHWFSDSLQIGTDPKDTIEQTAGKWFCELAKLAGAGKKGRERVKAFLSRPVDRAALKWEKMAHDVPRQFICVGTTNPGEYLDDPTGNRRFWICAVGKVDIEALRRDREMIWAEASLLEASSESTELPDALLPDAVKEQEYRVFADPFYDQLLPVLEDQHGLVAKADLWAFLRIEAHRKDPHMAHRLADAMMRLGFGRPTKRRKRESAGRREGSSNPPVPCFERKGGATGRRHGSYCRVCHLERLYWHKVGTAKTPVVPGDFLSVPTVPSKKT